MEPFHGKKNFSIQNSDIPGVAIGCDHAGEQHAVN